MIRPAAVLLVILVGLAVVAGCDDHQDAQTTRPASSTSARSCDRSRPRVPAPKLRGRQKAVELDLLWVNGCGTDVDSVVNLGGRQPKVTIVDRVAQLEVARGFAVRYELSPDGSPSGDELRSGRPDERGLVTIPLPVEPCQLLTVQLAGTGVIAQFVARLAPGDDGCDATSG